ncbi:transglutaminase domain-containing protein [Paenibacillus sp. NPDC057934]|uniref:transglutaminase domain-containing protein n=1 Tax=Paenibacillus sp. NPDC057934 TaxID=3346282 RepID=UPI0036D9775F
MLNGWIKSVADANVISIILLLIVAFSLLQGWGRGFSRSTSRLFGLLGAGISTLVALLLAVPAAAYFSPLVEAWASGVKYTDNELTRWQQLYYTAISVLSGSPVVRFLLVLLLCYSLIRLLLGVVVVLLPFQRSGHRRGEKKVTALSRLGGAGVGLLIGMARGLILVAVLFIGVALSPDSSFSRYVESSPVYSQSAAAVIEPFAGDTVHSKLPILTQAVAAEMNDILRRKYEIIDHDISGDITGAAADIVGKTTGEEEKARLLYDWVGSRVAYDYAKAENYEKNRVWHEQSPQDTFNTRLGVCIDYARLYAVMARSQGLQVRVVTGQGYDGRGGYGPHAWNEVYVSDKQAWIPLDPTWASSGNWFNTKDFYDTHIRGSVL